MAKLHSLPYIKLSQSPEPNTKTAVYSIRRTIRRVVIHNPLGKKIIGNRLFSSSFRLHKKWPYIKHIKIKHKNCKLDRTDNTKGLLQKITDRKPSFSIHVSNCIIIDLDQLLCRRICSLSRNNFQQVRMTFCAGKKMLATTLYHPASECVRYLSKIYLEMFPASPHPDK